MQSQCVPQVSKNEHCNAIDGQNIAAPTGLGYNRPFFASVSRNDHMMARLRPFLLICIAVILSACASSPESTLGELPRTPQASAQQLLQEADASDPAKAALLRLSAADQSIRQGNLDQARAIMEIGRAACRE